MQYHKEPRNWMSAYEICRYNGMQLLTIDTDAEMDEIPALAQKHNIGYGFWVAANDIGHEGHFVWATTGTNMTIARWHEDNPNNNGGEDCVEVAYWPTSKRWGMNDHKCSQTRNFFCEEIPVRVSVSPFCN